MKVFIDSSIPSLFLQGLISVDDESHLESIMLSHQAKKAEVITIRDIRDKICKIPELDLTQNNRFLLLLKQINEVEELGYCGGLRPGGIGGHEVFDPIFDSLINKVDNLEARQIYQAIKHGADYYLTLNQNILKRNLSEFKINIATPEIVSKALLTEHSQDHK